MSLELTTHLVDQREWLENKINFLSFCTEHIWLRRYTCIISINSCKLQTTKVNKGIVYNSQMHINLLRFIWTVKSTGAVYVNKSPNI